MCLSLLQNEVSIDISCYRYYRTTLFRIMHTFAVFADGPATVKVKTIERLNGRHNDVSGGCGCLATYGR